jgi:exonuclease III
MLLLSLNIRGIGGTLKVASFRRLVDHTRPEIIFLQETLVSAQKAKDFCIFFDHPGLCVQSTPWVILGDY